MKSGLNSWREIYAIKATPKIGGSHDSLAVAAIKGQLIVDYQVASIFDLRNNETTSAYLISCTQRLVVPNQNDKDIFDVAGSDNTVYNNYLGALSNAMFPFQANVVPGTQWVPPIDPSPNLNGLLLVDHSPKTLNTSVMSNVNQAASSSQSNQNSVSHSSGSSTSQTNSFDLTINQGFSAGTQGFDITGGASESFGKSFTSELSKELQRSRGVSLGSDSQLSEGYSMSIKDWSSYSYLDYAGQKISWLWGQEFPWNILQVNGGFEANPKDFSNPVELPPNVTGALYMAHGTQGVLLPPSQLSLYGVKFVSKSIWYLPASSAADEEYLAFRHDFDGFLASHSVSDTTVSGSLSGQYSQTLISAAPIPLRLVALDPIAPMTNAVIGFVPGQFIYPPDASGNFRTRSYQNNLYITGTGFTQETQQPAANPGSPDTVLSTGTELSATNPATLKVYFKLSEKSQDLALHMKHWRAGNQGCVLSISINGGPALNRHVDSLEMGGGSDNLSVIQLCNLDLASPEYFDYLQVGLNTIDISIAPSADGQQGGCRYAIRALAIA